MTSTKSILLCALLSSSIIADYTEPYQYEAKMCHTKP